MTHEQPVGPIVLSNGRKLPQSSGKPVLRLLFVALGASLILVPVGLWAAGVRPTWLFPTGPSLKVVDVDRGDIEILVVEGGTVENADNAMVRCKVEALLGTVGGQAGMQGAGGNRGGAGGGGSGGAGGRGGANTGRAGSAVATNYASSAGNANQAAQKTGTASKSGTSKTGGATGTQKTGTSGQSTAGQSGGSGIQRPVISSFSYQVTPHQPLRPVTAATQTGTVNQSGRGNTMPQPGGMFGAEGPGSTRVLKLLEEGTPVDEGDIVCWLDSAAFVDELRMQMIKWSQAKSWLDQAQTALDVAKISLNEYRDGVAKQDLQVINDYINICKIQRDIAKTDFAWSADMVLRGLQTAGQARGRELVLEKCEVALQEAQKMHERLERFTAPKLVANLEAKIAAVEADLQAQRSAFELEDQRKRRLEQAIENCVMKAPRDGIVVYVNQANRWGMVENPIREGMTVRQNQPIFQIPDSTRMRVNARVNESKVSLIQPGTQALIRVDALPDQHLTGTVTEVTVIPVAQNGPTSDVKVYYASVEIEAGEHEGLRPGMSAEVEFLVNRKERATRVPLRALRWFDGLAFAAQANADGGHTWRPVTLGLRDEHFAEVLSGLNMGDHVVADPADLPPPTQNERLAAGAVKVADSRS